MGNSTDRRDWDKAKKQNYANEMREEHEVGRLEKKFLKAFEIREGC